MGIPLFAPTLEFLTQLHLQYFFVRERSHTTRQGQGYMFHKHPDYNGSAIIPLFKGSDKYISLDPGDDYDARNVRFWLSLADFYTFPHLTYFDSIEHLVEILQVIWNKPDILQMIHASMRIENRERLKSLLRYWRRRLLDIAVHSPHKPN